MQHDPASKTKTSRCELIVADLLQSVPAGADIYMLKHVLHGRRDGDAITILKNCRAVIPQHGRLLIIEFVLPPLVSQADPQLEPPDERPQHARRHRRERAERA